MAQRHVIYGLFDPNDERREIRYVGYTHFTPEQRIIDHISGARRHNDTHKQKWIRKLLRSNVEPDFVILEVTTAKDWKARENFWIADLRAGGHRLTNSTSGGEGLIEPSEDVRKRISAKVSQGLLGNSRRTGKLHSEADRKKISIGLRKSKKAKKAWRARRGKPGHPMSDENKVALILANTGRSRPDYTKLLRKLAKKNRGSFWVNDGETNTLIRSGQKVPRGFSLGRIVSWNDRPCSNETRAKLAAARLGQPGPTISKKGRRSISEQKKNSRWITDGASLRQIPVGSEPPEGWRFGRRLDG